MTTEAYRVRCDGCGALEEVAASSSSQPPGWETIAFEVQGLRLFQSGLGRLFGHLCGDCLASPVVARMLEAMPGRREAPAEPCVMAPAGCPWPALPHNHPAGMTPAEHPGEFGAAAEEVAPV